MKGLHSRHNVTLVLVTHDATLAGQAQRQIVLEDGRIVKDELNHRDTEARRAT
jgi:predicted ABC-type transport system involved in lysophospholipase L1 biosynthesis ATPase subunit